MKTLKRIALGIDSLIEAFAQIALLSMILIVTLQVMTRKLFHFVLFWSEEVTLLLLVWFAFGLYLIISGSEFQEMDGRYPVGIPQAARPADPRRAAADLMRLIVFSRYSVHRRFGILACIREGPSFVRCRHICPIRSSARRR
ncbi:hypothetical protein PAESOLCIP111_04809 [Paenibacillus solanacearum]|uniref:TRAP transporter small permease subunit n=1 Tax=Paenibacillus solanacearum TaxID=2048548 RepID=A0A916NKE7_9BACL|nr:hypothetical protein PAESOLCIP111_04809 [Paenibacillus solanacearum]